MFSNNNFTGDINGVTMQDFLCQLDYKLKQKERVKHLHSILNDERGLPKPFFEELFVQKSEGGRDISRIKLQPGQADNIYSETLTAKQLESMANYILYAKDGESLTKRTKYNFFQSEEQFQKRVRNKRLFYNDIVGTDKDEDEAIDFLLSLNNQYKKPKTQKIYKEDLSHPVLAEYQRTIDILTKERQAASQRKVLNMQLIKELESDSEEYKKCKEIIKEAVNIELTHGTIIKTLKDDQLLAKDMLFGTIYFKQTISRECAEIEYDSLDFNNPVHIREALRCGVRNNLSRNLDCITTDIDNLIKNIPLNDKEKKVLDMLRSDARIEDIVKSFEEKTYKQYINQIINKIIKLISKEYNKSYNDWYYTNVEKGTYYKCNKCKEQKLKHHFNSNNFDKSKIKCIDCEKKDYQIKKSKIKAKKEVIECKKKEPKTMKSTALKKELSA